MERDQSDRTVLLNRQAEGYGQASLGDFDIAPRYACLEDRLAYSGMQRLESLDIGLNPLVAAAAPLLSAVVKVKARVEAGSLESLKTRLVEHLRHFEMRALEAGVDHGEVMLARYVLCTMADEAVVTTQWGDESEWASISLLSSLHDETFGGEKFFELLEHMGRNPIKHLAMLELMYICMALGFEGKFRVQARGSLELEAVRDSVYRQIRHLRGDVPHTLSPHLTGLTHTQRGVVRLVPAWLVTAFTGICLVVMFSGFAYVLGEKRRAVLQHYHTAGPVMVQTQPYSGGAR